MHESPVSPEPPFRPEPGLRIVCILASAGGLEPLKTLVGGLRPGLGAAVLVLQHFPEDRVSHLPELLAGTANLPIQMGRPGDPLRPDTIHVLSGGMGIEASAEGPVLVRPQALATQDLPGDHLLRSVAALAGPLATAVVLSGTGRDGVEGLRAIRDAGGRTLVQAPATAAYEGMPRQAIEAGVADRILAAEEMAEALLARDRQLDGKEWASGLREVCATLARLTGHDFHGYKQGTLLRRVHRRMRACNSRSLQEYAGILARNSAEGEALLADLLIGVTEFFRDAEAFEALGLALEASGAARDPEGFRAWVPGCATGEEAYSVAILLRERLERGPGAARLKVFASDIDVQALMRAKQGLYGPDALKGVAQERRLRWFHEEPEGLRVRKDLQEACLFSYHNLLQDPPFSSLDLVSCRNLFIYLLPEIQQRVVPMLHFALRPGGLLFLGPSDGIGALGDLFEPLDPVHRIYRRREVARRPTLDLASPMRFPGGAAQVPHRAPATAQGAVGLFEKMLLQEFVPPSAIVNAAGDVLYGAGGVGRFLLPAAGYPSGNLLQGGGALQTVLRGLIHRAAGDPSGSAQGVVEHDGAQGRERLRVMVRSLPGMGRTSGTFAVVLAPAGEAPAGERGPGPDIADAPLLDQLDIELRATRAELQMTVEDLESANEELRSSNEELQTSQEELQSVNEELVAINRELQDKVQALHEANADLQNLFSATDIATLFLDTSLRLTRFTPAGTALFGLLPTDTGRPIQDLSPRFSGLDLPSESRAVLADALPRERQVRSLDGERWYVVRILPYRNLQQEVRGVVVTFVDSTEILRTQEALADREDRLRRVQAGAGACTWEMDVASGRLFWSPEFYALLGLDPGMEPSLALWRTVVHPGDAERVLRGLGGSVEKGRAYENEYRVLVPGGGYRWVLSRGALEPGRGSGSGRLAGLSLDITARKEAELRRAESEERLETALSLSRTGAWAFDPVTGEAYRSQEHARIFGDPDGEGSWSYATFLERVHPEDREWVARETRTATEEGRPWDIECRIVRRTDKAVRWIRVAGGSDAGAERSPRRMAGVVQDITDRKTAERALWESESRFRTLLSAMGEGI
ncbi:MAG TPA: chemotaxis protein CheB, partial [Holophaga sp.]|nr:chemotaxis protein CheB [Holophaga sp.]